MKANLNTDWKFTRKSADERAWQKKYNDSTWRDVILPHDWSVEEPFDTKNSSGTGYLSAGKGWYRKTFQIAEEHRGKRVYVEFDGVYNNSRVWCNGYYLGKRPYGYSGFTYDITEFACFGETPNVIAVHINHEHAADSRWFTGSGIYRKVSLIIKDQVCIDENGIFVSTDSIEDTQAIMSVVCTITNHTAESTKIDVSHALDGATVEWGIELGAGESFTQKSKLKVPNPKLWSPDTPNLYTLSTVVKNKGLIIDIEDTITGIRTVKFDADTGMFLNGKPIKMKGVCVHHDAGCLGAAVLKNVWRRRLEKLKEMGCNAIRMSHNPHMPELYELCDEMGFLAFDEAFDEWEGVKNKWQVGHNVYPPAHYGYSEDFPEWHECDLAAMVLRNRNHPSIFVWSIGNEIDYPNDPYVYPGLMKQVGNNDAGKPEYEQVYDPTRPNATRLAVVAKKLVEIVKKHDTTRPVTAALAFPELSNFSGFAEELDIVGYNYRERLYKQAHEDYPARVFFGSENTHGVEEWQAVLENDFIAGQFLWTGIDFLGETKGWPSHGSEAGLLTVAGFEKPGYYLRKSMWVESPFVQLSAELADTDQKRRPRHRIGELSWNFAQGEIVRVMAFTNCAKIELLLNGKSHGIFECNNYMATIEIPFEKGELRAIAYTANNETVTSTLTTYSAPAALRMTVVEPTLIADGQSVAHVEIETIDYDGNLSANANNDIYITVENGTLLGLENGNLSDNTPYSLNYRRAHYGQLLAYIRAPKDSGEIIVVAQSQGLAPATVKLIAK